MTDAPWITFTNRRLNNLFRAMAAIAVMVLIAAPNGSAETPVDGGTIAERDARMDWWREARFGMFIHWGLYSAAGGEWEGRRNSMIASWISHEFEIPPAQYEAKLKPQFTADRFEPAEWARLAKRAGMKYMVITAKHHEGFCLFDSELTDYDSADAAAGRDMIRPMLDAFRDEGLRVGVYYSMIDWHHSDYPVVDDPLHPLRNNAAAKAEPRDLSRYVDYMHGQVRELMTNYGPIDILWWDYSYGRMSGDTWRAEEMVELARSLQPNILMNNRLTALDSTFVTRDERFGGDFQTPEQFVPPNGVPGLDWETCMTINTTWGYKPYDKDFKSSRQLIRTLIETASRGGNFLLNVGPRPDGTIPEEQVARLEAIGEWLDVNGEAIYGTTASPFPRRPRWGRVTTGKFRNGVTPLYLHVFDWPQDGKLRVDPLENEVTTAYRLADQQRASLPIETNEAGVIVTLPGSPLDADATVVVLEVQGRPVPAPFRIRPNDDGRFVLAAAAADLHGDTIRYPSGEGDVESIGWWTDPQDWVSWPLAVPETGYFRVNITYGCDATGGGAYTVEAGDEVLRAESRPTGGWFERVTDSIGTIHLPAGQTTVALRVEELSGVAVLDLVSIELVPADHRRPAKQISNEHQRH